MFWLIFTLLSRNVTIHPVYIFIKVTPDIPAPGAGFLYPSCPIIIYPNWKYNWANNTAPRGPLSTVIHSEYWFFIYYQLFPLTCIFLLFRHPVIYNLDFVTLSGFLTGTTAASKHHLTVSTFRGREIKSELCLNFSVSSGFGLMSLSFSHLAKEQRSYHDARTFVSQFSSATFLAHRKGKCCLLTLSHPTERKWDHARLKIKGWKKQHTTYTPVKD